MRIPFTKMHGAGNDFIVLRAGTVGSGGRDFTPEEWRALGDRRCGIGFDQALVIEPARREGTAAYYRIFNSDGGEVEQCGNGVRCIAELLRIEGQARGDALEVEGPAGIIRARFGESGVVAVDMGEPSFDPGSLPFLPQGDGPPYTLDLEGERVSFEIASMGNPHAVLRVDDVDSAPVRRLGPVIERHPAFPKRVNVGFVQQVDRTHLRLRVFERGVGETLACGTGTCAAAAVLRRLDLVDETTRIDLPGGRLTVRWQGPGHSLWLEGPAEVSFRGTFES